ncbi:MAG: hypothetical protein JWP97_710 [Labilithrix sp.]|nr:hypothetical protein [Labilithrix sp.]
MNPRAVLTSLGIALTLGAAGCRCSKPGGTRDAAADAAALDPEAILKPIAGTTAGAIAVGNLGGQIGGQERRLVDQPGDVDLRAGLVGLYLARGEYTGSIKDYEHASEIAAALVKDAPWSPQAWKAHASVASTWHLFDQALADLERAEKLGAPRHTTDGSRASILAAIGKADEAWQFAPTDADPRGQTLAMASRAYLEAERGKLKEAEDDLAAARARYRDVSPFPMAWIDTLEANLLEKNGERAKARAYYTRAVRILPQYAKAASHLATYETPERAVAILAPVAAESDDPEVHAAYGDALRRTGRTAEGQAEIAAAKASYETLLAKHPEAFADHAARFYLGAGAEPAKALPLARDNAKRRPTDEAVALWLEAAQAVNDAAAACEAARVLVALPHATELLRAPGRAAAARCK